jgi:ssDNA-binding Zn-finger/Zn-ribbon topoisomerase 1
MSKIDHSLFSADKHALEKEYEICPQCGSELVIRNSKSGPFLGCASYPKCDFIRPLAHNALNRWWLRMAVMVCLLVVRGIPSAITLLTKMMKSKTKRRYLLALNAKRGT